MESPEPLSKITLQPEDCGHLAASYLPINPYGLELFVAPDDTEDSRALLDEVAAVWLALWPKMRKKLEAGMKDYDVRAVPGQDEFVGALGRIPRMFTWATRAIS